MLGAPRLRRTRDATRENGLHETFVRIKSGYYSHSAGMADGIMHASLPALCACRKSSLAALMAKSAGSREQRARRAGVSPGISRRRSFGTRELPLSFIALTFTR
jgi:hypothetical protein